MSNKKQSEKDKEKKEFQWRQAGKTSFIWIAIILVTIYFSSIISDNRNNEIEIDYTEYKHFLDDGLISKAVIIDKTFHGSIYRKST